MITGAIHGTSMEEENVAILNCLAGGDSAPSFSSSSRRSAPETTRRGNGRMFRFRSHKRTDRVENLVTGRFGG